MMRLNGGSVRGEDVDHEHQRGVGRNGALLLVPIAEIRRHDQQHLRAYGMACQTLLSSLDYAVQREGAGLAAVPRGIELGAVKQPTGVIRHNGLRILDLRAVALDQIL